MEKREFLFQFCLNVFALDLIKPWNEFKFNSTGKEFRTVINQWKDEYRIKIRKINNRVINESKDENRIIIGQNLDLYLLNSSQAISCIFWNDYTHVDKLIKHVQENHSNTGIGYAVANFITGESEDSFKDLDYIIDCDKYMVEAISVITKYYYIKNCNNIFVRTFILGLFKKQFSKKRSKVSLHRITISNYKKNPTEVEKAKSEALDYFKGINVAYNLYIEVCKNKGAYVKQKYNGHSTRAAKRKHKIINTANRKDIALAKKMVKYKKSNYSMEIRTKIDSINEKELNRVLKYKKGFSLKKFLDK